MSAIQLRQIERTDIPKINLWRNDPEVVALLGANFHYLSQEIDQAWFDHYLKDRDRQVRLAIIESSSGQHIGNINLTQIHPINRAAEFSIVIGDKTCWSKGYGTIAGSMLLKHGFADLNLERIYLYVLEENDRAIKMYEKLGFVKEGQLRNAVFKDGKFKNIYLMAVLKSEFTL